MVTINPSWKLDESIRKFLDVSLVGTSIVDPDGIIVYVNKGLAELFETTEDKMVGRIAAEFYLEPTTRIKSLL